MPDAATRTWEPDVLGEPYRALTLPLGQDEEGELVATLVHRPAEQRRGPAVLQVHGFCDYFFQTPAADFWTARGHDFYALDLRKYGRSLRPGQTPAYVEDLARYYQELDAALAVVREQNDRVLLAGHSTGGLTVALYLQDRRPDAVGLVLNSPWLDLDAHLLMRTLGTRVLDRVGESRPHRLVPRARTGLYGRSLSAAHDGEFPVDLRWRPIESFDVHAGWLRAVRQGHARVARGLDLTLPTLVLTSARHARPTAIDDPDVRSTDIVLDVAPMRRLAPRISRHLTLAMVEGAVHDVTLSPEPARSRVFDELDRWLSAYVDR